MIDFLNYLWYNKRTCKCCGVEFWRVKETTLYEDILYLLRLKEDRGIYVCSMGCALSLHNWTQSSMNQG